MLETRLADPLWASSDHRLYVPTESFEAALSALEIGLRAGCSPLLLSGPHGIGKTLLLRVLAERESVQFQRTWLLRLSGKPDDLPGVLLRVLFDVVPSRRSRAAQQALVAALRGEGARRTLLLVDDIDQQSESSVRKLAELARATKPALAIVVAGTACEDRRDLAPALGAGLSVFLPESLPDAEMLEIYDALIAHPGLPARLREELEEGDRATITARAGGVPQRLKNELARRKPSRTPATPPAVLTRVSPVEPLWDEAEEGDDLPEITLDWESLAAEEPKPAVEASVIEAIPEPVTSICPPEPERGVVLPPAPRLRRKSQSLELARWALVLMLASWEAVRGWEEQATTRATAWRVQLGVRRARARRTLAHAGSRTLGYARTTRERLASVAQRSSQLVREGFRSTQASFTRLAGQAVQANALPLALVLVAGLLALPASERRPKPTPPPAATPPVVVAALRTEPAPVAHVLPAPPPAPQIDVHVNARPWARVWIDGVDLGATPLRSRLPAGHHRLEARFPNGRRIARNVDVGPDRRFISLR
jgi:AAA domain-containing protein/PEGA domain-containing protein